MSIWSQRSASIQQRTSRRKFDELAEKSEKDSVSNFLTKALTVDIVNLDNGIALELARRSDWETVGLQRQWAIRCPVAHRQTLVKKFDTESFSDFSAKSSNFPGLVLCCINADLCDQILIFQHFSRSTRFAILCTAQISNFSENS